MKEVRKASLVVACYIQNQIFASKALDIVGLEFHALLALYTYLNSSETFVKVNNTYIHTLYVYIYTRRLFR